MSERTIPVLRSLSVCLLVLLAACGSDDAGDDSQVDTGSEAATGGDELSDADSSSAASSGDAAETEADPADGASSDADADSSADDGVEPNADDNESDGDDATDPGPGDGLFPDVLDATASQDDDGTWRFSATLSSPYDTAARYADAWRIVGTDGEVFGIRELAHDHQAEQPFTRSLSGVTIPDGVTTVVVEGRDQFNGWGGATVEVQLTN